MARLVAEHGGDLLSVHTSDGTFLYASPSHRRVLGYEPAELMGTPAYRLGHLDDWVDVAALSADLYAGDGPVVFTARLRHRDGHYLWMETSMRVVREGDDPPTLVVACSRPLVEGPGRRAAGAAGLVDRVSLLELAADAILVHLAGSGELTFWSRAAQELYGWTAEEALGRPVQQLLQTVFPCAPEEIQSALGSTGTWDGELVHTGRDGRPVRVLSRWNGPTSTGIIVQTDTDITAQRAAELRLQEAQEQFRLAFERAPVGMGVFDAATRFLRVNPALCQLLGYREDELLAMTGHALLHPDDADVAAGHRRHLLDGETEWLELDLRYVRSDGSVLFARVSSALVRDASGTPHHFVGLFQDIGERLRAEEEAAQLSLARAATVAAQEADLVARERLLAGLRGFAEREEAFRTLVAHELATPIAAVRAFAHVLDRRLGEGTAAVGDGVDLALKGLRGEAERLGELVGRMDELRTLELEEFACDLRPVLLRPLLDEAAVYMRGLPGAHPVEVTCDCGERRALVDSVRIAQALRNLLNNAARYSPATSPVHLHCGSAAAHQIELSIEDRGQGISPEERELVLGKFQRGSAAGGTPGSGLGLYIARRIAEAHGGRLFVSDLDDIPGARVVIELAELP